jgi:hypothetical protein
MRPSKTAISIAIVLVIALHAVPVLSARIRLRTWPFLEWTMYHNALAAGPVRADVRRLVAVTSSGREMAVDKNLAGVSSFVLIRQYIQPIQAGDSSAARRLLVRLNRERDDSFVEIRLKVETYTVTDTGLVRTVQPVITYRNDSQSSR